MARSAPAATMWPPRSPCRRPWASRSIRNGNLFIAEFGTNRIRKVDTNGKITTAIGNGNQGFAGDGGPPDKVEMSLPTSVVVDSSGTLYFADSQNNRIRKLSGGTVSTYAGNGGLSRSGDGGAATAAQLNVPQGVAVDASGNLYIADTANNVVRRVRHGRRDRQLRGHRHGGQFGRWQRRGERAIERAAGVGGG